MFEMLGRYVAIDFAVAMFVIHCGESIAYNASIEISRVVSVLACQVSRVTATCPQSRDEVTRVDLGNYLKIKSWP
jgi:Zn finger protein HypA/HybF involved in hydrogenase expression